MFNSGFSHPNNTESMQNFSKNQEEMCKKKAAREVLLLLK